MSRRLGLVGAAAVVLTSVSLFAGLAEGAASGKVIGMTSGGGVKGGGVVTFGSGLGRTDVRTSMTISTPIDNVQVAGTIGGQGVYGTSTGGQLTATLTDTKDSCTSFLSGASTWTGSGEITFGGSTGTVYTMKLKHYSISFWRGVSYGSEKATVSGDGVKNGSETGFDSFYKPTGFSCSTPGAVLKSLAVVGVLKITAP